MVYIGPLQRIVSVGWRSRGKFASLKFNSVWQNGAPNSNNFEVTLEELGLSFNIYDAVELRSTPDGPILVKSVGPYHLEEFFGDLDSDTEINYYKYEFTGPSAFATGWYQVMVVTDVNGSVSTWSHVTDPPDLFPSGSSGPGGQAELVEFVLSGGGFDTATVVDSSGPVTSHHTGDPSIKDTDNALILFDLAAIRAALPPIPDGDSNPLTITFSTGDGPATVHDPDHVGLIGYVWTSTFDSYNEAQFADFTVDEFNIETGTWPDAFPNDADLRIYESDAVQPTPSTDVTYMLELVSLELF